MSERIKDILGQIGNTPLVSLNRISPNKDIEILAKLEFFNPGGSIKDRPALYMIEAAEKSGELTKDKIILEATSGNTGIGLALVAAVKGYRILLTMCESVSKERIKILRAMGAQIQFTPDRMGTDGAIEFAYKLARDEPENYWLSDQFNNEANWMAHYQGTAMEVWDQVDGDLDVIVAAMGTTGTLMGLSRRMKELAPQVQVVGVEPYLGHKIQGLKNMKESYQPGIFEKNRLARVIHIDDEEAFRTSRELARKEGLFVGMSSGAVMAAVFRLAKEMDQGRIVAILPDGGERYLSTPLFMDKKKSGLRIYNTLSRRKEEFIPIEENRTTIYSCGPTLCRHIDLGQCRRFLFADLLRRYLEFKEYEVTHIMNVTDIDDRTIEGAEKAGLSLKVFTEEYYRTFMEDIDCLSIKRATKYPKASEHIEEMIELAQKLVEKGYAYEKFRSIYFDISRFEDYGKLSRIDLNKMKIGKTVDLDEYEKENPRDFTLLKRSTLNELKRGIFYETRWGNVRPGWHIECPAMAIKSMGPTHDIHTSGMELVFPHHENAMAIAQAFTGRPLANYWVHNELVSVKGHSQSSDEGQMILKDLLDQGFTGREIRYWLLSRHYRKPITFSHSKLSAVKNTIAHIDMFVQKIHFTRPASEILDIDQHVYDLRRRFVESLDDDLNIAGALAALFGFIRKMNLIIDQNGLSSPERRKVLKALEDINSVLCIMDLKVLEPDKDVKELIEKRELARKDKSWDLADRLRHELKGMGIEVIDTKDGPLWRRFHV